MKTNGKTELYGLIGNPVEHSMSPFIHSYFAEYTGQNTAYAAFNVSESGLNDAIKGAHVLGIKGLNITMPHKQAIIPLLYEVDELAKRINSVNTIKHTKNGYAGYNTDILGFAMTIQKNGIDIKGKRMIILGAGGSASSAAFAAADYGISEIIILNRTTSNANKLAEQIKKYYNISVVCDNFENLSKTMQYMKDKENFILVQATAVGFSAFEEKSPVTDMRIFERAEYAIDFIYSPYETVFLKMAKNAGCKVINGIDILIFQASTAYKIWTGAKIPSECTDYLSEYLGGI